MTYNSKHAAAITNKFDELFRINIVSLEEGYPMVFSKEIKGEYIKMNQIEQTDDGKTICIPYQDNGVFYLTVISLEGEIQELVTLNVSEHLGLDDKSKPITGFWEPLITASFIKMDSLFVSAYHRLQKKQYHFIYDYKNKQPKSPTFEQEIKNCTPMNFPIKSFYSVENNECYVFYRQG